jgi:peptidyl-prolyl cis-trans isomerase A (cyclophilin A)
VSKRIVIAAALVAAGIVGIYGTYQFQSTRLTPGRLRAMQEAETRIAKAEQVEKPAVKEEDKRPVEPVALQDVGPVPDEFTVRFHTTVGDFLARFHKDWAPLGVERVYQLVKIGYYDDTSFFRVVPGYVVQWGLPNNSDKTMAWIDKKLPAESPRQSNKAGTITFAMIRQPDTRSVQLFINLADNAQLDEMGFVPVGEVVKGMDVVKRLNAMYGERPTKDQGYIAEQGGDYLQHAYPGLDKIVWAVVEEGAAKPAESAAAPAPQGK